MQTVSLYVHIPFCIQRCGYCDFNTYAGLGRLIPDYTDAVCKEIEFISSISDERITIHTIYFGGGTPSLIPVTALEKILGIVENHYHLTQSIEITLEANPGTISPNYLADLHVVGVNRLSFGMQSAHQDELALLERRYSFSDVVNAVEWSRAAGFNNLNLDLIYGIPQQRLESWVESIASAISLNPEHLSLYALTLEAGTRLKRKVEAGMLPEPDHDLAADMYELACDRLSQAGYIQYEISNWAREASGGASLACRHNMQYWRNFYYLGVGAGAHGFINKQRTVNISTPGAYIKRMNNSCKETPANEVFPRTPATTHIQTISLEAEIGETMMMGLRLVNEGVSQREFQRRFGLSMADRFSSQIDRLIKVGLVEWAGEQNDILRLTQRGKLLGNQVFREFI